MDFVEIKFFYFKKRIFFNHFLFILSHIILFIAVPCFHLGMKRAGYNYKREFEWLDGTNVGDTYSNFAAGEPNNDPDPQHCGVFFTKTGSWKSEDCGSERFYACQRLAGTNIICMANIKFGEKTCLSVQTRQDKTSEIAKYYQRLLWQIHTQL